MNGLDSASVARPTAPPEPRPAGPPLLARLTLGGFLAVFAFAASYVLLDAFGVWPRLPAALVRGLELATGAILLATLAAHLVLASGAIRAEGSDSDRAR
jgi:hypothetical protein